MLVGFILIFAGPRFELALKIIISHYQPPLPTSITVTTPKTCQTT